MTFRCRKHVSWEHLSDENLTLKTRGLLAYLLSSKFRNKFDAFVLAEKLPEGTTTIQTAIRHLLHHEYIEGFSK